MNVKVLTLCASLLPMAVMAETENDNDIIGNATEVMNADSEEAETATTGEFASDERLEEGFITSYVNTALADAMATQAVKDDEPFQLGRKETKFASVPKFGGYFIGKYDYTDKPTLDTNGGFSQRLVRMYVDGTILGEFAYRIQVQTNNNSFHMKDFFVEWQRHKEFRVKVGQFKRAFGMENPMNPWDVGAGDYSQITKKLTGHNDYIGLEASNNGGRDQGVQIQGDLFPASTDGHRYVHYQLMMANGQGINTADANKNKDFMGTIQIQPIKGLFIGAYAWDGDFTCNDASNSYFGKTVNRNRYMGSIKYDANDWTFRAEYAYSKGKAFNTSENKVADGWYATLGVPVNNSIKIYGKYDVYRPTGDWQKASTIYSIIPNIQMHKNLMLQLQYNFVHDRSLKTDRKNYNEVWVETYVRF